MSDDTLSTIQDVSVRSETGTLRRVLIGLADTFVLPEPINKTQRIYHRDHPEVPTRERLLEESRQLRAALESFGVQVHQPDPVPGVPDQLTPRDIGVVIGDTLVVASMATTCRQQEWRGMTGLLETLPEGKVIRVPNDVVLEGGDVVVDRGRIFIGVGERSTPAGAEFMRTTFSADHEIQVVSLTAEAEGEDVLHLDCVFVPVGREHALVYPAGMREIPESMREYNWIEVSREEQARLATNVLSLSPEVVISSGRSHRINAELRAIGIEVIELSFVDTKKGGGSFRCASLPLVRDDI